MSYFNNCGNYEFTPGQKTEIIKDLMFSPDRAYIRSSYVPDLTVVEEVPTLLFPSNGSMIPSADQVVLSWIPVLTADYYVVEIDVTPSFTSDLAQSKTVPASVPSAIFEFLAGNAQYYWRVRPFTEYYTCTGLSDQWEFTTPASTAVQELDLIESWELTPNVLLANESLILNINAFEAFTATIEIYDFHGQLIYSTGNRRFMAGEAKYELPVHVPNQGMYILSILNEEGISSRKFVRL